MPNLLLTIRYDGTDFHGWQVQSNAVSVQQVLQDAIQSLFGQRLDVKGCSRTDSGVHANMYCVSFEAPFYPGEYHTLSALNRFLPHSIKAYACREVPEDFHARYHTKGKEYIYRIYNAPYPNPFYEKYSLHYKQPLDIARMNEAAAHFVGTHDFKAFCSAHSDVEDTVRTIERCKVERVGDIVTITVAGDGFLYNMVRIIVGTLIYVSEHKIQPEDIPRIIQTGVRNNRAGKTMPAKGLFLNKVFY